MTSVIKVKQKRIFAGPNNMVKRFASALAIVVGLTLVAFSLSYFSPSDPVEIQIESYGLVPTEELVSAIRADLGLDKPFIIQYLIWLRNFFSGDMGTSITTGKPVAGELFQYLPNTLLLTISSLAATMLLSIIVGVLCAVFADGVFDYALRFVTYLFASVPGFLLALLLLYFFGIYLKVLPVISNNTPAGLIMPVALLTFTMSAHYIRQIRAIVLDQLSKDFVVGCKARGIPFHVILFRHVLKSALVPIITLAGMSFGGLLGGSAIVENIFTWNGIGRYALKAIELQDYPVIEAYVVWMALIYLAVNLLVDLVCALISPHYHNDIAREATE